MGTDMKADITLSNLLRYFLSGGYSVLMFILSFDDSKKMCAGVAKIDAGSSMVAGVAIVIGAISYSFYRALIFPIFVLPLIRFFARAHGDFCNEQVDMWRRQKNCNSVQGNLGEWADQVHFLACSGLTGLAIALVGNSLGLCKTDWYCAFTTTSFFLVLAALVSLFNLQSRQERVIEMEPHPFAMDRSQCQKSEQKVS